MEQHKVMLTHNRVVAYRQDPAHYSKHPPFHSPEPYPEYPFHMLYDSGNYVYRSIRDSFYLLGLDIDNYGSPSWNPLKNLINPYETIIIKPNLIAHSHKLNDDWEYVITHGSVIRTVIDYVYIALRGVGKIIIADAPQTDSNVELIKQHLGLEVIQELYWKYKKFEITFLDLRNEYWIEKDGICVNRVTLDGDPLGSTQVNLRNHSLFTEQEIRHKRYYGAFYDINETNLHHYEGTQEYLVSRTALESDVFISLPKMKTHKKVGVTLNLKGLVGINSNKNWLPHYAIGSPEENGDQFPSMTNSTWLENKIIVSAKRILLRRNPYMQFAARKLKKIAYSIFGDTEEVIRSGNWHGNDTAWRMTLDLNRILLYANPDGTLRDRPKRYFSVVDGIIAMEGNGPVAGTAKPIGYIVAGSNPLATDMVCTKLMGFDYQRIPMLCRAFDRTPYPVASFRPEDIYVISNQEELKGHLLNLSPQFLSRFAPHFGWKGHVEL
jgi:uncharacterized protein (DUF362 family)